jgi:hypothetical protein
MSFAVGDQELRGRRRRQELLHTAVLSKIRPGGQAGDIKAAGDWRPPLTGLLVDVAEWTLTPVTALPCTTGGERSARVGLLSCESRAVTGT